MEDNNSLFNSISHKPPHMIYYKSIDGSTYIDKIDEKLSKKVCKSCVLKNHEGCFEEKFEKTWEQGGLNCYKNNSPWIVLNTKNNEIEPNTHVKDVIDSCPYKLEHIIEKQKQC